MFDLLLSVCQCVWCGCNYWVLRNKFAEDFTCNGRDITRNNGSYITRNNGSYITRNNCSYITRNNDSYITRNNGWSLYFYGVGRRQRNKQTGKKNQDVYLEYQARWLK